MACGRLFVYEDTRVCVCLCEFQSFLSLWFTHCENAMMSEWWRLKIVAAVKSALPNRYIKLSIKVIIGHVPCDGDCLCTYEGCMCEMFLMFRILGKVLFYCRHTCVG